MKDKNKKDVIAIANGLRDYYNNCIKNSIKEIDFILNAIPNEWNIPKTIVEQKLNQLMDSEWTQAVWMNFMECLNDNLEG